MPIITVPKALRGKLGKSGSEALVEMLRHLQEDTITRSIEVLDETVVA
ncbi:MAG: hypothetical protein GXO39_02910 [Thermotogae bacterium]|nr:hypothetical protein [Thermotogota bacterium]